MGEPSLSDCPGNGDHLTTALAYVIAYFFTNVAMAVSAAARSGAIPISRKSCFIAGGTVLATLFSTLAVLCTQQRCCRVVGKTASRAFQKPSAPSATASSGAMVRPRAWMSTSSSRQLCTLSTPGGQARYSPMAIETALMVRLVFQQPLRQTEGLLSSLLGLMGVDLPVPDHTTISRRAARRTPVLSTALPAGPVTLVIDSTGLKVYGAGEWHRDKHGVRGPRTWRKLHLVVDAASNTIVAVTLTTTSDGDASQVGPLLDQTTGAIDTVMADGAYDGDPSYQTIAARDAGAKVVIPPRATAVLSTAAETAPTQRDRHIQTIAERGAGWTGSGRPTMARGRRRKPQWRAISASSAASFVPARSPASKPRPPSVSPSSTA